MAPDHLIYFQRRKLLCNWNNSILFIYLLGVLLNLSQADLYQVQLASKIIQIF